MENTPVTAEEDVQAEEVLTCPWSKDMARKKGSGLSKSKIGSFVGRVNSKRTLESRGNKFKIQSSRGLNNDNPKDLASLHETYIWGFLKQIHIGASKAALSNSWVNSGPSNLGKELNLTIVRGKHTCDLMSFVVEWPLNAVAGDVSISSTGQWIVGTAIGSKSMINILKSPSLFLNEETIGSHGILKSNLLDVEGSDFLDLTRSRAGLSVVHSLPRLQKHTALLANHTYGSRMGHTRHASMSTANLSCMDQLSASTLYALSTSSHGMLHCKWRSGIPHYIFSIDNRREVYEANLMKAGSSDDKAPNYVYLFYLMNDQKGHSACKDESTLIGKMKVSTSFALCPNNSLITNTEFVLFSAGDEHVGVQTLSRDLKKSHGFTKKVAKAFGSNHGHSKRLIRKYGGTGTALGNHTWEPSQNACNNLNQSPSVNPLDNDLPPHLELAAVVVRDHTHNSKQKVGGGGWGLKFLNTRLEKAGACSDATSDCRGALVSSEGCSSSCSTSMEILVPADYHGRPSTSDAQPSSLIQRWRSGGGCDCGGWDIGCPLTILNTRWSKEVYISQTDAQGECKSFNLFTQGSEQSVPTLKVVNIHDSLYYVQFQSTLTALQSLSLSVAIIHTQSVAM